MRIMGLGSVMLLVLSVSLSCCSESTTSSARADGEMGIAAATSGRTPAQSEKAVDVRQTAKGY